MSDNIPSLPAFGTVALDLSTIAVLAVEISKHLASPVTYDTSPIENGFLTAQGAADYLGVKRKRIHDLTSMGALVPDGRDGRTPLFTRDTLDNYARSSAR